MALCPSFSTYSSGTMADIAARVVEELRNEPHPDTVNLNLFHWTDPNPQIDSSVLQSPKTEHPEEDEFEFAFVTNGSPISADQIFSNGLIKPVFNTDLLHAKAEYANSKPKKTGRTPLGKLMMTETTTSSSDDLTPGTYCVWAPQKLPEKTKSMRWKLRELLHRRSNSDGKDNLVKIEETRTVNEDAAAARGFAKSRSTVKRRTYLPYKQELVGLLSNVNGFGRNLRPF